MKYHNNNHFDIRHVEVITGEKPKNISVIIFQLLYVNNTGYFPIFAHKAEVNGKHFSVKKVGDYKNISFKKESLETYLNSFKWANIDVNHFVPKQYKEYLLSLFSGYDMLIAEVNSIAVSQSNIAAYKELFVAYLALQSK